MKPYTHEELMTPSTVHWPIGNSDFRELRELARFMRFLFERPEQCRKCRFLIIGRELALIHPRHNSHPE